VHSNPSETPQEVSISPFEAYRPLLSIALNNAQLPEKIKENILQTTQVNYIFFIDLSEIKQSDPFLWYLVDKERPLPAGYEPDDLVELGSSSLYRINRTGLLLRKDAVISLEEMAAAARNDGLILLASSAYRSYDYQFQVYNRFVSTMGVHEADKISARPGHSQHQLGLTLDFGSIDDSFARTSEGIWLAANASRFGWSLSYPLGYEEVTGYSWESWHFRYVGKQLAEFIDNYFDGIQQYALRFIYEYRKLHQ